MKFKGSLNKIPTITWTLYASYDVIHISCLSNLNVNTVNYVSFYLVEDYSIVFNM